VKVLSRLASPAGFALVLLLFFVLPFLSVSCDVPGYGEAGMHFSGADMVVGTDPEYVVPAGLEEVEKELVSDGSGSTDLRKSADVLGVRVLAVVLAVLAAAGALTGLLPRARARLFGAAAAAGAALAVAVVTMVVGQSNLQAALTEDAHTIGEGQAAAPGIVAGIEEMVHTDLGFWLVVVVLTLIGVSSLCAALFGGRLREAVANATDRGDTDAGAGLSGLSFGEPEQPTGR
jgi:hypothetical protein